MLKCNQCGADFYGGTEQQQEFMLRDHIKKTHTQARLDDYDIPPSKLEDIEKAKTHELPIKEKTVFKNENVETEPIPPVKETPVVAEPIVLEYKYKGQCPTCMIAVDTMEFEVAGELFMIAYCVRCRKKCMEKKVMPIYASSFGEREPIKDATNVFPISKFKKKK